MIIVPHLNRLTNPQCQEYIVDILMALPIGHPATCLQTVTKLKHVKLKLTKKLKIENSVKLKLDKS